MSMHTSLKRKNGGHNRRPIMGQTNQSTGNLMSVCKYEILAEKKRGDIRTKCTCDYSHRYLISIINIHRRSGIRKSLCCEGLVSLFWLGADISYHSLVKVHFSLSLFRSDIHDISATKWNGMEYCLVQVQDVPQNGIWLAFHKKCLFGWSF